VSVLADSWQRAALALRLLALDPEGLRGAVIRMRSGPDRAAVTGALPLKTRRIHPNISDEQLYGGLDLSATLKSGHIIDSKGLFSKSGMVTLAMAERCGANLAAKLALQLDADPDFGLIALDEGAEPDEATPPALSERLAFCIEPIGRMPPDWPSVPAGTTSIAPRAVTVNSGDIEALTVLAARLGIDSLRAPQLALATARAHAALNNRLHLTEDDLEAAAALVYPHRATTVPEQQGSTEETPPPDQPDDPGTDRQDQDLTLPDGDMMIEAIKALLPADLLAGLVPVGTTRAAGGGGAGKARKGNRRGRPLPSRPGRLDGQTRIDLVATLRAAAPWQPMRRAAAAQTALAIRPSDIRVKRYQDQSDRLLIFTVDASGSAAMSRLNEAKGAVELLLGQAYAARDHVALIAFRGTAAELLLPPTRSLVQTKRRLATLPGGGGTPLAAGLQQSALLASQSIARGMTPTVILLTDGRANVALDGTPDRAQAGNDAERLARMMRAQGTGALVIDMGARPTASLKALAGLLGAPYLALPRADAQRLTGAVSAALGAA
jgi:magnesium chelatase subunit D